MAKPKHDLPMRLYATRAENLFRERVILQANQSLAALITDGPIGTYELVQVTYPKKKKK